MPFFNSLLRDLPEDIVESILSRMLIRDVVRTSVLATNWRYRWTSMPRLIFDDECIPGFSGLKAHARLVRIINQVLLAHKGPIQTLIISSSHLQACPEINSWIHTLSSSSSSLEEFKLVISKNSTHRHIVPLCLFSFNHLICLQLVHCEVIIPPSSSFNSLSRLRSLDFESVTVCNTSLKCLISSCPALESLELNDIDGVTYLEISNPQLRFLTVRRGFIVVYLNNLRCLVRAFFTASSVPPPDQLATFNFSKFLGSLLSAQVLLLGSHYMKALADSNVASRIPSTYVHLRSIIFDLKADDMKQISVAKYLLNSCPNLDYLAIWFWHGHNALLNLLPLIVPPLNLEEARYRLELVSSFNRLRIVHLFNVCGTDIELALVQFILANSPALEKMKIRLPKTGTNTVFNFSYELMQFRKAYPRVEITYMDTTTFWDWLRQFTR